MLRRRLAACALALTAACAPATALAGASGPDDRVATVQATLDADEPAATRWFWIWSAAFVASGVANGAGAFVVDDPANRASARVNAVSSGVALVAMLVSPWPAMHAGTRLRAFQGTPAERERAAERLLQSSAEAERFESGWLTRAGGLVINAAAGAWLTWHDHYPWHGLLAFVTGQVVCEIKIATVPTAARDRVRKETTAAAYFAPTPGGMTFGVAGAF